MGDIWSTILVLLGVIAVVYGLRLLTAKRPPSDDPSEEER